MIPTGVDLGASYDPQSTGLIEFGFIRNPMGSWIYYMMAYYIMGL